MMEIGRDGVCVPARVTPTRAHPSLNSPHTMHVIFGMETPLRGRSGGHIGTAPTVSFGWITHGMVDAILGIAHRRLISFGQITRGTVDVVWMDCV